MTVSNTEQGPSLTSGSYKPLDFIVKPAKSLVHCGVESAWGPYMVSSHYDLTVPLLSIEVLLKACFNKR